MADTYTLHSTNHLKKFECHTDEIMGTNINKRILGIQKDLIVVHYAFCQNKENLPSEKSLIDNPKIDKNITT